MRVESVEIYSDQGNAAVLRHPDRRFPGLLIQGDSLFSLCQQADLACEQIGSAVPGFDEMNHLRNALWTYLNHYRVTLTDHGMNLPFSDA